MNADFSNYDDVVRYEYWGVALDILLDLESSQDQNSEAIKSFVTQVQQQVRRLSQLPSK
jgi:hypothetical protein